jgi:hypothetical protein
MTLEECKEAIRLSKMHDKLEVIIADIAGGFPLDIKGDNEHFLVEFHCNVTSATLMILSKYKKFLLGVRTIIENRLKELGVMDNSK